MFTVPCKSIYRILLNFFSFFLNIFSPHKCQHTRLRFYKIFNINPKFVHIVHVETLRKRVLHLYSAPLRQYSIKMNSPFNAVAFSCLQRCCYNLGTSAACKVFYCNITSSVRLHFFLSQILNHFQV